VKSLTLTVLDGLFSIHRLQPNAKIPDRLLREDFYALVKTEDEMSIVCSQNLNIIGDNVEHGWNCFKDLGPLDFELTGILAGLAQVLAEAKISIFALSTFDTDYLLVRSHQLAASKDVLKKAGYLIRS